MKKDGDRLGVLGFLKRMVAATMGCFFGCFAMKSSKSRLKYTPLQEECIVSRDRNSRSLLFQPDEDDLLREAEEGRGRMSEDIDINELKNEAKFLKSCGTLLETPIEIRKVSSKLMDKPTQSEELDSLITSASIDTLRIKEPIDETSTPVKSRGEWVTRAGFVMGTPSSSMATENVTRRGSISSSQSSDSISSSQSSDDHSAVAPKGVPDNKTHCSAISSVSPACATMVQRANKSVRFACHTNNSEFSSENSGQHTRSSESGCSSVSRPSPYPTPLHLTDEMQTPGTAFPAYVNNISGAATKIRSQHVYSVLNPIHYPSQLEELDEELSDSNQHREYRIPNDENTLTPDTFMNNPSVINDKKDDLSLSEWLNSYSVNQDGNANVHFGRTPGDRPILGMVAAHWNDEETTNNTPKWFGGNGIPNSTTKYKEDQKVSWHATPFEERLEKALSEDKFVSQRKKIMGAAAVELDESDTASSQLQSCSSHVKSIVSF